MDGGREVCRRILLRREVTHDDGSGAWHAHIDDDVQLPSAAFMTMGNRDENAAAGDTWIVLLEPRNTVANCGFNTI